MPDARPRRKAPTIGFPDDQACRYPIGGMNHRSAGSVFLCTESDDVNPTM